jgi:hypothetical protein
MKISVPEESRRAKTSWKNVNMTLRPTCTNCAFYVFVKAGFFEGTKRPFHGCSNAVALPGEYYGWCVDGALEGVVSGDSEQEVVLHLAMVEQARGLYLPARVAARCGGHARLWKPLGTDIRSAQDRRYFPQDFPVEGSAWHGKGIWADMQAFHEQERLRLEYEAELQALGLWPDNEDELPADERKRIEESRAEHARNYIGRVTITSIGAPHNPLDGDDESLFMDPQTVDVSYSFTGQLSETQVIAAIAALESESFCLSRFDAIGKTGGYVLIDDTSRLAVGQLVPVKANVKDT